MLRAKRPFCMTSIPCVPSGARDLGSVTVEDLETLRTQDIVAAVTDACAEKGMCRFSPERLR
jgi:hypothetical protein